MWRIYPELLVHHANVSMPKRLNLFDFHLQMLQSSQTKLVLLIERHQSQFLIMDLMCALWNTTSIFPVTRPPISEA